MLNSFLLPVAFVFPLLISQRCIAGHGLPLPPAAVEQEGQAGVPQEQGHDGGRVPPLHTVPLKTATSSSGKFSTL